MGCTQPVGTDSFGGMSCLKFDKGLVDQSTNLSDITEKKISNYLFDFNLKFLFIVLELTACGAIIPQVL